MAAQNNGGRKCFSVRKAQDRTQDFQHYWCAWYANHALLTRCNVFLDTELLTENVQPVTRSGFIFLSALGQAKMWALQGCEVVLELS